MAEASKSLTEESLSDNTVEEDQKYNYEMEVTRHTVDQLGVKMYDKISAAVAELIANSWDADAENVEVKAPLGKFLATHTEDGIAEKGYTIEVKDDGHGMCRDESNSFFLPVGKKRRKDENRGERSREKGREVMGRKGIGKLAPFGVCGEIEVRSAGGEESEKGYEVSHFLMRYKDIVADSSEPYHPEPLEDDGTYDQESGTTVRLRDFEPKKVPDKDTFFRQLARKFKVEADDFEIKVVDTKEENPHETFTVEIPEIELMEGIKIDAKQYPVTLESGEEYRVKGWIGLAKEAYKNEEWTGVRIYVRGKLASVTRDFGQPSGFTGEFMARSYMVGEIEADWLDEEEDLIQTHRQDILWESKKGKALRKWGKEMIKKVADKSWEPRRNKVKDNFLETSNLGEKARERYESEEIQEAAVELGEKFGKFAHEDELENEDYIESFSEFILDIAPHKYLVETLQKIEERSEDGEVSIKDLVDLFQTTHIAEITSLGQVAKEKVKTIEVLEENIRSEDTDEGDLQEILEDAPWLINPTWTPVTENQEIRSFRSAFEAWYEEEKGDEIVTTSDTSQENKKPDFIMLDVNNSIKVIEIKSPGKKFYNDDFDRFSNYVQAFDEFFEDHPRFRDDFPNEADFIIVADGRSLNYTNRNALETFQENRGVEPIMSWEELLKKTKKQHRDFFETWN